MADDEKPDAQQMHAVSRKPFNLTVINHDRVLLRTILLGIVQEDPVNGFFRSATPLKEKSAEMNPVGAGDVQKTVCLVGIEKQHGAGVTTVSPLRLRQQSRVRVNFQVMAKIPTCREIDGAAH